MNKLITYFSATQDQITGLVALLIVCAMLLMIGMLIRPQRYMPEIDLIAGWSLVTIVFVVAGGLGGINFQTITTVLVLTAILSLVVMLRKKRGLQVTILRAWPFPRYKDPNTIQN